LRDSQQIDKSSLKPEATLEKTEQKLGSSGSSSPLKLRDSQQFGKTSPKKEKTEIATPKVDSPKQSRPVETPKKDLLVNQKKGRGKKWVFFGLAITIAATVFASIYFGHLDPSNLKVPEFVKKYM